MWLDAIFDRVSFGVGGGGDLDFIVGYHMECDRIVPPLIGVLNPAYTMSVKFELV